MKLPVSNTNAPVWRDMTVKAELPSRLKPLDELARNLWWVWNSEAKTLFRDLNPDLWRATGENPVMLLQQLTAERLDEILSDNELLTRIDETYIAFQDYMNQPMRKTFHRYHTSRWNTAFATASRFTPEAWAF